MKPTAARATPPGKSPSTPGVRVEGWVGALNTRVRHLLDGPSAGVCLATFWMEQHDECNEGRRDRLRMEEKKRLVTARSCIVGI